jgi:hypothetical protein
MASHVHCRVVSPRGTQPQNELFPYIADEHPNIQSGLSQSQPSQRRTTGIVRPEPTCARHTVKDDVWSCDNHECHSVDCHTSRLFLHPAVSDQSVLGPSPGTCSQATNARHLYSSQAGLQRRSSWPAHLSFRSSSKCPIMNCSVFCFHRESSF